MTKNMFVPRLVDTNNMTLTYFRVLLLFLHVTALVYARDLKGNLL